MRSGLAIVFLGFTLFALLDLRVHPDLLSRLYLVKLVQFTTIFSVLVALRSPRVAARPLPIACVAAALFYVSIATSGVLRADVATTLVTYVILFMATAILLPWGPQPQAATVVIAVLAILWNVQAVDGSLVQAFSGPVLSVVVAAITSVYIAYELQRYRIEIDSRTAALTASEQRQAALIRAVPVTLHRVELRGQHMGPVWISEEAQRATGFPCERFTAPDAVDFWISRLHPDDSARVTAELTAMRTQGVATTEYRWRCADGSYRWFFYHGVLLKDRRGTPREIVGSWLDITERKTAEQAVQRSEEYFRSLIEGARDLIAVLESDGTTRYVSPSIERMLGYRPEEWIGRHVLAAVHPDDVAHVIRMFLSGPQAAGEVIAFRVRHKDGSWRTIEAQYNAILSNPAVAGIVINAHDVTERERAEVELQDAKEAAEAANHAKGEFLANVSHEIRTPMNAIIGMTDIALDTQLTDEQRQYLEVVRRSGLSLLALINEVLDIAKIEARKVELVATEFRLRDLANDVISLLVVRARSKGLDLIQRLPGSVPDSVIGDPGRLRQVLVNLVGNAVKFTDTGTVTLDVGVEAQTADAVVLHFRVTDTGKGIPAEKQQLIFQAYEQVGGASPGEQHGTGLGLSISKTLIERMGGRIWVESEPGRGSTFQFTIRFGRPTPRVLLPDVRVHASGERALPSKAERDKRFLRILLVDDNTVNQQLVTQMLQMRGHTVIVAADGHQAVAAVKREHFDLVLMDVQMSGMDGLEATTRIRALEREHGTHVPIIALTARAMKGDRERCLQAGMDGYLSKPIRPQELLGTIDLVLMPPVAGSA